MGAQLVNKWLTRWRGLLGSEAIEGRRVPRLGHRRQNNGAHTDRPDRARAHCGDLRRLARKRPNSAVIVTVRTDVAPSNTTTRFRAGDLIGRRHVRLVNELAMVCACRVADEHIVSYRRDLCYRKDQNSQHRKHTIHANISSGGHGIAIRTPG